MHSMKTLRGATFWLTVIALPGGVLLLTPWVYRAIQKLRRFNNERQAPVLE